MRISTETHPALTTINGRFSVIEIEIPLVHNKPPLTMNQRLHWTDKAARTKRIRETVAWQVKALRLQPQNHISVALHFTTGDKRRRDADNLVATLKPCCDGIVDSGLIPDDTPEHLTWWSPAIHTGPDKRRMWLEIRLTDEVAA
jgi:crossover junction endodeoxyribonuclease RusA